MGRGRPADWLPHGAHNHERDAKIQQADVVVPARREPCERPAQRLQPDEEERDGPALLRVALEGRREDAAGDEELDEAIEREGIHLGTTVHVSAPSPETAPNVSTQSRDSTYSTPRADAVENVRPVAVARVRGGEMIVDRDDESRRAEHDGLAERRGYHHWQRATPTRVERCQATRSRLAGGLRLRRRIDHTP